MKKLFAKTIYIALTLMLFASTVQITFSQTTVATEHNSNTNTDALVMNKKAEWALHNDNLGYILQLQAYATGDVKVSTSSKPNDILLVLDTSGSMVDGVDGTHRYSIIYADTPGGGTEMWDYTNVSDNYYILDDVTKQYVPVFRTEEFQYGTKITNPPPGWDAEPRSDAEYKVYAYRDSNGKRYVPAKKDGTTFATNPYGTAEEQAQFENYEVRHLYRYLDTQYAPGTPSKISVLKESVTEFINNAAADGGDHRFAIVSFDDRARTHTSYLSVKTDKDKLLKIVDDLTLGGATDVGAGMEEAKKIIDNDAMASATDRSRAVVMFTDGKPESSSYVNQGGNIGIAPANKAISIAKDIKAKGYTVYAAGISSLLDNTIDPSKMSIQSDAGLMNTYMQYLSSNYPNASSLSNSGEDGSYTGGKFLYATDKESFKKMFETIRDEISTTTSTLDEKTVLTDYVSEYFNLDPSSIKAYTIDYLGVNNAGYDQWGNKTAYTVDNDQITIGEDYVSITGFSYKDNYVIKGKPGGKAIILELFVFGKEGFIGGLNVNTNKEESGIYYEDTFVKEFEQPLVNSPLIYSLKDKNESVYITKNNTNIDGVIDVDLEKEGIQFYAYDDKQFTLDGINNAFVDIFYEIKDEAGKIVGKCNMPAKDTTLVWTTPLDTSGYNANTRLTVSATVISEDKIELNNEPWIRDYSSALNINVFKPTINVKNDYAFAGESYDLNNAIESRTWNCIENPLAPSPRDTAPVLKFDYSDGGTPIVDANAHVIDKTTTYKINTLLDAMDITAHTTIVNTNKPADEDFEIRALTGEIAITKTIDEGYSKHTAINSNQSFLFKITVRDPESKEVKETFYQTIDFDQHDLDDNITSKTISLKGLKRGLYEIKEETNWSWKYNLTSSMTNYKDSKDTLFIGEDLGYRYYFGTESGTTLNQQNISNPGKITLTNSLNSTLNVIGDCANAINMFVK